jgi:hypothetical protein
MLGVKILVWITWIILAAFGLYLWFVDDVQFKRRVFPWFSPVPNLVLLVLVTLYNPSVEVLVSTGIVLLFSTYTLIRFTRFCNSCGGTVYNGWLWLSRMKSCYHCAAKIDDL